MIPVFPCVPGDKNPLTAHGFKDASNDPATLARWRDQYPNANWAMPTGPASGYDVLDLDVKRGVNGRATLSELEAIHGQIMTPMVATPSGGLHLYFRHRPGTGSGASRLPGVDVRAEGGYVIIPPSSVGGGDYIWLDDIDLERGTVAEWPDWLWGLIKKPEKPKVATREPAVIHPAPASGGTAWGRKALDGLVKELSELQPGSRDDKRNRICFRVGRIVAGGNVAYASAVDAMIAGCEANGLAEDLGAGKLRQRIEAGIESGIQAGPVGPAPLEQKREVVVTTKGVDEAEPAHDEQQTDVGNGKRLVRLFGADLRWCKPLGWLGWNGEKWERTDRGAVQAAKESAHLMRVEAESLSDSDARKAARKHALGSEKSERIRAAVLMAQSEDGIPIEHDALDRDPWLLAVSNGVLDLRTGKLRPHSRADLITRTAFTKWDPEATCPRWQQFLIETFSGDYDLIEFVEKAIGYTLTGVTREQVLFLCYGEGSNGKSTLLSTMRLLMGDHATNADFSTFLLSNKSGQTGPRGDLARLAGVRLVTSTEPEGSARFSEGTVKSITGGDPITCAFKFQDEFSFVPKFKLWLGANHKPRIRGTDHAIWRRIRLIPFLNIVEGARIDKGLDVALATELPGILRRSVEACLRWQAEGLEPPEAVLGATNAYREEQDTLAEFLADRCHVGPGFTVSSSALYGSYKDWATKAGDEAMSKRQFGLMIVGRGISATKLEGGNVRGYTGVRLQ